MLLSGCPAKYRNHGMAQTHHLSEGAVLFSDLLEFKGLARTVFHLSVCVSQKTVLGVTPLDIESLTGTQQEG